MAPEARGRWAAGRRVADESGGIRRRSRACLRTARGIHVWMVSRSVEDRIAVHVQAGARHLDAADRHADAADFWERRGDPERAEIERRLVRLERDAAQIERDLAALEERRAGPEAASAPNDVGG